MFKYFVLLLTMVACISCSDEMARYDGYWQLEIDPNTRQLTQCVLSIEDGQVSALTYFAGPLLNVGVNTESSDYNLIGSVRCGNLESGAGITRLQIYREVPLSKPVAKQVSEVYNLNLVNETTMSIQGVDGALPGTYIKVTDLRPGEAGGLSRCVN